MIIDYSKTFQMTVKGWVNSVVSKKVGALDSKIEEREAKIARLETTERDIEESIFIKEKYVKRLLKKIDTFWIFRNTWRMLNRLWKHSYKRQRVPEKVWRRK